MIHPDPNELAQIVAEAHCSASPLESRLISALYGLLSLTGPYVRAGLSSAAMVLAFEDAVAALTLAAQHGGDR